MKKHLLSLLSATLFATVLAFADTVFDFSNSNAGWTLRRNNAAQQTPEGIVLTVNGTYPNIGISGTRIEQPVNYMLIDYKLTNNDGDNYSWLFFGTDAQPQLAEDKKFIFKGFVADGEWHTFTLNVANHKIWREAKAITALRLDFMEKAQGTFTIKRISLVEKQPSLPCPSWDFTKANHGWTSYRNANGEITSEGLKLTINGTHPNVANYNLSIDPTTCQELEVTYKAYGFPDNKNAFMRCFFGTTKSQGLDEDKKIPVGLVVPDGEWRTLKINPHTTAGGRGLWFNGEVLTKIRIDFAQEDKGVFILKSIKPIVSRETGWRKEIEKKGVPTQVPVQLGQKPKNPFKLRYDHNQPFFESKMAAPAGRSRAVGSVFVRKEFTLPDGEIESAFFQSVTDDRTLKCFINGQLVEHKWQETWQRTDNVNVTKYLKSGRNLLAIEYYNDGDIGGIMFDVSIRFKDNTFINITTDDTLAAMGDMPADWFQPNCANLAAFTKAELFPGPPHYPWTSVIPKYINLHPIDGAIQLESFKCNGFQVSATFKSSRPLKGDEIFFAHLKKPDGSLIAYSSGKAGELKARKLSSDRIAIDFEPFDLPEYGGEINAQLLLGVHNCDYSAIKPQAFHCDERPYPAKQFTLKNVRTPNGVIAQLDGKPFYFNILSVAHMNVPSGMEGKDSPFNVVGLRIGGMREAWWIGPDQYDFTDVDRSFNKLIKDYPDSKIGVYFWCHPGTWYEQVYPERISRQADGQTMRYYAATVCFSDADVRADAVKAVTRLVEHCEKYFGGKVALYNLMGGISCEWQGWNAHTAQMADYSMAAQRDFVEWLKKNAPDVPARMPTFAERSRPAEGMTLFRDPIRDNISILYDRFYSESIADFIDIMAKATKKASGGRKLVGAYYGYHQEYGNLGHCMNGGGHNALYRLLQSPDIDFILSPQSYGTRSVGAPNSDMKPFTTASLQGKFSMLEDDTRTNLTSFDGFYHALNADQTREILRRNWGVQLARKVPLNHLPLVGGNDIASPEIRADFTKVMKVGQRMFERNLPRDSQVAVVLDEQSARLLAFTRARGKTLLPWMFGYDKRGVLNSPESNVMKLMGELIYYQRTVMGQIGCPVDYIQLEDAPKATQKYKLLVMLDCFEDTPLLRHTFANAKANGCHVLTVYGNGFMGKKGVDVNAMSDILGMKLAIATPGTLMVKIGGKDVGGEYAFSPRFTVSDGAAKPLANYSDTKETAVATKGNVTFYGGAQLDAAFVQQIAKEAGVHVFMPAGDNLEYGSGILSIHSASKGKKQITLPRPARLTDIFSGETINAPNGTFTLDMDVFTTKVFEIN